MVILDVNFEVPGEIFDALAEQRNLHLGRACVRRMNPELLDHLFFLRFSNPHISAFSLSFLLVDVFLPHWIEVVKHAQPSVETAPAE